MQQTILAYVLIAFFFVVERNLRRGHDAKSLERGVFDRGSTLALVASFVITLVSLLAALVLPQTVSAPLRWLGIGLMVGGLALRIWAFSTLGRFYTRTLLVTDEHKVVKEEPYTHIRHPGYLGVLGLWIGAGLATGSLLVLLVVALVMGVAYTYRIRSEEAMLVAALGDQYESYRANTWRLVPLVY